MISEENLTQAAWLAMGATLRRTAERRGGRLSAQAAQGFDELMRTMALSDDDKSVCTALPQTLHAFISAWRQAGLMATTPEEAPLVVDEAPQITRIYTSRQFAEEKELAERLVRAYLNAARPEVLTDELEAGFRGYDEALFQRTKAARDPEKTKAWRAGVQHQYEAVKKALSRRFSVITGGPGTGKTSTVVRLLTALLSGESKTLRIVLAAPTGKAAGRMLEAVDDECAAAPGLYGVVKQAKDAGWVTAQTIHRLLMTPNESGEMPSEVAPLAADVLVVDEASMIDQQLALRLMRVVDVERTRLVFLGDKYQLAAVGRGSVFSDMTDPRGVLRDAVTELTYSFRFGADSPIGCAARAVNSGDAAAAKAALPPLRRFSEERNGEEAGSAYSAQAENQVSTCLAEWMDSVLGGYLRCVARRREAHEAGLDGAEDARRALDEALLSAFNEFRLLCAQRRGRDGVDAVNRRVAQQVCRVVDSRPEDEFYVGGVVIVRANDRATELFNGDVGIVTYAAGSTDEKTPKGPDVYFGDGRWVPAALLPEYDSGYALTIHQSQGSQFRKVAVVLSDDPASQLTTRELLYTGITRAKQSAVVFAADEVIEKAVETPVRRLGGLSARLREAMPGCHEADTRLEHNA